jgi:hypothetical protein
MMSVSLEDVDLADKDKYIETIEISNDEKKDSVLEIKPLANKPVTVTWNNVNVTSPTKEKFYKKFLKKKQSYDLKPTKSLISGSMRQKSFFFTAHLYFS